MRRTIVGRHTAVGGYDREHSRDHIAGRQIIGQHGGSRAQLERDILARKSVLIENEPEDNLRRQVCPVPSVSVPAGGTASVTVQPQRLFKCERLSLNEDNPGCLVQDIKVGQKSQFAAEGNIPVASFAPTAVSAYVDLDTADIGNLITVSYSNPTMAAIVVSGAAFGATVD